MQKSSKKNYERGINSEKIAALWLQLKGYKIIERRYKTAVGEIDIIARHKKTIAFVEVKARQTKNQALESITQHMTRRIENAARYYISHHDLSGLDMRFDLIAVMPVKLSDIKNGQFFIHHLDNAWQATA